MPKHLTSITTEIVAAYVGNNSIPSSDLPDLLMSIHAILLRLTGAEPDQSDNVKPEPAVAVKTSIHNDHLVSLIDGKPYKTLRRHLRTHGMTPDEYRTRYDLPTSYPMVCKAYSIKRSELARHFGLGHAWKQVVAEPEQGIVTP